MKRDVREGKSQFLRTEYIHTHEMECKRLFLHLSVIYMSRTSYQLWFPRRPSGSEDEEKSPNSKNSLKKSEQEKYFSTGFDFFLVLAICPWVSEDAAAGDDEKKPRIERKHSFVLHRFRTTADILRWCFRMHVFNTNSSFKLYLDFSFVVPVPRTGGSCF